jgi:MFS family permease
VLGSFFAGRMVDITQQHENVALTILCTAFFATLVLALVLDDNILQYIDESSGIWSTLLVVSVLISGCTLAAWDSIAMEFGARMGYPANEAAVGGLLECAAELAAFVFVLMGGWWLERDSSAIFLLIMCAFVWLSMMLFMRVSSLESHLFATMKDDGNDEDIEGTYGEDHSDRSSV